MIAESFTAFSGTRRIASGDLRTVALALKGLDELAAPLVFNDRTARRVELDLRGSAEEVLERLGPIEPVRTGPGRPKLGVVAREVTLLPRHWEWLAAQPGGASVALRKLVEVARRASAGADELRVAREAAYRFMHEVAGNLPGYEEATRALFAGDRDAFSAHVSTWPEDVRDYVGKLAEEGFSPSTSPMAS
ncbi:DUF2239 family protein [Luteolibacter sp. LG18]|uniref:DUF2239 family protein n=1 Tax=Luteolibacter sp. LG18 TaxID=2819286 RepID=UPI002B2E28EC|nr:hypothetical protein llg_30530 [Luteolibacter sp. LG18]